MNSIELYWIIGKMRINLLKFIPRFIFPLLFILGFLIGRASAETLPIDNVTTLTGWYYEERAGKIHGALDIPASIYTPIRCVKSGVVVEKGFDYYKSEDGRSGYGNYVIIKDNEGYFWLYGHLNSYDCKINEYIHEGQIFAEVGYTGMNNCKSHLHLEKRDAKKRKIFFTKDFGIIWTIKK